MNNFFENHLEEIQLITSRSKKESRKSFSRLQKKQKFNLTTINGEVTQNEIHILEGINVHQYTDDGKVTLASSDRIYLPDVATRLYQSLDNILKAYKPHKVHIGNETPEHDTENISIIDYIDLSEWDNELFLETLNNLYSSLSQEIKDKYDIEFDLDGNYSIWDIFTPNSQTVEFDEFLLILNYRLSEKGSTKHILDSRISIPAGQVRNKNIKLDKIVSEITIFAKLNDSKDINNFQNTDLVIFAPSLTSSLFLVSIDQGINLSIPQNEIKVPGELTEKYDKYGRSFPEGVLQELDYGKNARQSVYHKTPHHFPHSLELKESVEEEGKDLIENILKLHSKKKFLLLFGSTDLLPFDKYHDEMYFSPVFSIYYDGKKFGKANVDYVEVSNPEKIKFSKNTEKVIQRSQDLDLYFRSNLPQYSYINSKEVVLI